MDKSVQYIIEVARYGGITRAAENLFITPSALSKFVQAKEKELNVQLFHRIGKKFVLSQAGQVYVEKCMEIDRVQKELDLQMKQFSSISHSYFRLGVQATFVDQTLKNILPKFRNEFPGVKIILQENRVGELLALLRSQQVDAVIAVTDQCEEDEFRYMKIFDCELVLAVRKDNALLSKAFKKEGFSYPWIDLKYAEKEQNAMLIPGSPFRAYADNLYEYYNLKPNIAYQVGATRTGLACVAKCNAVMITLDHMAFNNSFNHSVKVLSVGEKAVTKELNLICRPDTILRGEMQKLYEIAGRGME